MGERKGREGKRGKGEIFGWWGGGGEGGGGRDGGGRGGERGGGKRMDGKGVEIGRKKGQRTENQKLPSVHIFRLLHLFQMWRERGRERKMGREGEGEGIRVGEDGEEKGFWIVSQILKETVIWAG